MHLKAVKEKKNLSPWKLLYHWQLLWHWPRSRVRAKCDGPTRFIVSHLWVVTFTSSSHVLPAGAQAWKHMKADNTVYFYTCRKMKTLSLPRSNTIWCILFCLPPHPFLYCKEDLVSAKFQPHALRQERLYKHLKASKPFVTFMCHKYSMYRI